MIREAVGPDNQERGLLSGNIPRDSVSKDNI
ncbi:MAG: hypothetical protein ACJAYE_002691 [Candidatus Azotimanducaceae bacterium]|jgi:hypothetical protein